MLRVFRTAFMLSALAGLAAPALAATTETFIGHARYEATRQQSAGAGDPQVFVADANAPDATGVQGVAHIAGYRRARLADDLSLPVYNAQGVGLSLSLGRWFGAGGSAELLNNENGDGTQIHFKFTGLVPFGVYSIFAAHRSASGTVFAPYAETTNSLTSSIDGFLETTAVSTTPLETGDLITLVYHSDGQAHGQSRGDLGVTAHEQLILPLVLARRPDAADSVVSPVQTAPPEDARPVPSDEPAVEPSAVPTEDPGGDVFVPSARRSTPPSAGAAPTPASIDDEPTF